MDFCISYDAGEVLAYGAARFADIGASAYAASPWTYFATHEAALAHVAHHGGRVIADDTAEMGDVA